MQQPNNIGVDHEAEARSVMHAVSDGNPSNKVITGNVQDILETAYGVRPAANQNPHQNGCSKYHKVNYGDLCAGLWRSNRLSEGEFMRLNPNINCNSLQFGQDVCVGGRSRRKRRDHCGHRHTAKEDETCWSIADRSGLSVDELLQLNPSVDCDDDLEGTTLCTRHHRRARKVKRRHSHDGNYVRGCYYASWSVYRAEPNKFPPDHIPVDLCTHVFYAFAGVNKDTFEAKMNDQWGDENLKGFEKTNDLKKKKPELKTLLSFGGWTESQEGVYAVIARDPAKRAKFVRSAWDMVNNWGFDGIDMDWEYPDAANRANFVGLIKALKESSGGKLVTAAVSAGIDKFDAGYDVQGFNDYIDLITVMTYDFHGSWEMTVGHHSGYRDTERALAHWHSKGMPKNKIVMGIGAHSQGWVADTCQSGSSARAISPSLEYSKTGGIASYFELLFLNGRVLQTADGPFMETTIKGQKTCYGFDDRAAVLKKMDLVKRKGYASAFSWTIDFDDKDFTIHNAIMNGLRGSSAPNQPPSPSHTLPPSPPNPYPSPAQIPPAPPGGLSCSTTGQLRANSDPHKYEECVWGKWMVRPAPPGTVFDETSKTFKHDMVE